jgi:hypothetical protein
MTLKMQWGSGNPGTVATEHLTKGPQRHPKGIPRLALVAAVVDPRFKFGPGFTEHYKRYIWDIIRQLMSYIARKGPEREAGEVGATQQERQQKRNPRERGGLVDAMFLELDQIWL